MNRRIRIASFIVMTGVMGAATQADGPMFALAFAGWLMMAVLTVGDDA